MAREVASVVLTVAIVLGGIWLYTGQELGDAPVVVVESGSMMHCADGSRVNDPGRYDTHCRPASWGRLGTIEAGDVILVKDIDGADDISTFAQGGKTRYGHPGDVVIYRPVGDDRRTPIIHRALFHITVHPDGNVSIRGTPHQDVAPNSFTREDLHALGVPPNTPDKLIVDIAESCPGRPGFVTAGDNNQNTDMTSNGLTVHSCPVQTEWIIGKARGEVPWIGLLKLRFTDAQNYGDAPSDLKRFMWGAVALVVAGPFIVDLLLQQVRRLRATPADGDDQDGSEDPDMGAEEDARPDHTGDSHQEQGEGHVTDEDHDKRVP